MIYTGTYINSADNTSAKLLECIRVLNKKKFAKIGDKVVISVKETLSPHKIKAGDIYIAIIVRTKRIFCRNTGSVIYFSDNAAILIDKEDNILGTRLFGPIPREIKKLFPNITLLAKDII